MIDKILCRLDKAARALFDIPTDNIPVQPNHKPFIAPSKQQPAIAKGQFWYVRLPHCRPDGSLTEVEIVNLTDKTVHFKFNHDSLHSSPTIHERVLVDFIEQIEQKRKV